MKYFVTWGIVIIPKRPHSIKGSEVYIVFFIKNKRSTITNCRCVKFITSQINIIFFSSNTSIIGYGGSFIFDKKDNLNFRTFYTMGSLWDNDYSTSDNIFHRSSIGISLDILTPVFPISFTYAIPLEKKSSDITKEFNFSLGTSF